MKNVNVKNLMFPYVKIIRLTYFYAAKSSRMATVKTTRNKLNITKFAILHRKSTFWNLIQSYLNFDQKTCIMRTS